MKVKDIIKQVAIFVQQQNLIDANLDDFDNLDAQTKKDVNLVVSCLNEVCSDIASDFLLLKKSEDIEVANGEFDIQNLTQSLYKIISFDDKYSIFENKILSSNGNHKISYYYLPPIFELNSDILCFDSRLTIFALSYGVSAELCLVTSNYSESEMWNSKFQNSMNILRRKASNLELKTRRWL